MRPPIIISGHDDYFAAWAAVRLDHVGPGGFGNCRAFGIAKGTGAEDARLLAVVVFNSYEPRAQTIQISCASTSPMWAHPETIRALLRYPFEDAGVFKAWVAIPHTNERAIRFNEHALGMRREGVIRHQFGPKLHAVILGMTRHEWGRKWKEVRHGHAIQGRLIGADAA